ncbi:MAG TPA: hypothetical protein VME22_07175, partial [Solirubrobacteraceae bacterium]|nr:hypothetical protein [Solirubrobacteraceae bacterium]
MAQLIAHLTADGAEIRTGELISTGTISAPDPGSQGSMIELTHRGTRPIVPSGGQRRVFLHEGYTVTMRAQSATKPVELAPVSGRIISSRSVE